jgi:hypothetical protein
MTTRKQPPPLNGDDRTKVATLQLAYKAFIKALQPFDKSQQFVILLSLISFLGLEDLNDTQDGCPRAPAAPPT